MVGDLRCLVRAIPVKSMPLEKHEQEITEETTKKASSFAT